MTIVGVFECPSGALGKQLADGGFADAADTYPDQNRAFNSCKLVRELLFAPRVRVNAPSREPFGVAFPRRKGHFLLSTHMTATLRVQQWE